MNRLLNLSLVSVLLHPTFAPAMSCGEMFRASRTAAMPAGLQLIKIYPPSNPIDGRSISLGLLADIFGEFHRLRARSADAFAHLVALVQLAEVEAMVPRSLRSTYADARTGAAVEADARVNLWDALAQRTDDPGVAELLRESKLITADGHLLPFVRDVLEAAMATITYTSLDDIWAGTGHVYKVVPSAVLADRMRYAPAVAAARLYDPLLQDLAIEKPTRFDFPCLRYSTTLGF